MRDTVRKSVPPCVWDEAVGAVVLSSRLLGLGSLAWLCAPDLQEAVAQKQMKSGDECSAFMKVHPFFSLNSLLSVSERSYRVVSYPSFTSQ